MAGLQSDDPVYQGYAEAKRAEFELHKDSGSDDHVVSSAGDHELDGIHDGLEFPTGVSFVAFPFHVTVD